LITPRRVLRPRIWLKGGATRWQHHPELTDGEATAEGRGHLTASWFSIAALVVALVISFFSATAGIWALLLLVPSQIIAGRLSNKAATVPTTKP
jgi:hypothetical protein